MGIDVITENIALFTDDVFKEVHSISQWAYPNRILKAAYYVATSKKYSFRIIDFFWFGDALLLTK